MNDLSIKEQKILLAYLKEKLLEEADEWSYFKSAELATLLLICAKLQKEIDDFNVKMGYTE